MKSQTLDTRLHIHYPLKLYTDGGVIFKNPSPYGVTCAFALVKDDHLIHKESYLIVGNDLNTNNQSELLAIVFGLEFLHFISENSIAEICSDSEASIRRTFLGGSMNNVPQWIQNRLLNVQEGLKYWNKFSYTLLGGHPTRTSLKKGTNAKGQPVSRWNALCDELCRQESQKFLETLNR